ncbi:hypothetical protein EV44_g3471 [Erysiphe necator]|uniref:Uncharacterized protein n=1 Tax=Uncinula necator TaxID=52586 RepID=A0A0B1P9R4_UNCNE|nr:hypothetical protein EV44_g3471 [Erysiphe necator]
MTKRRFDGWQVDNNYSGEARSTAKPNVNKPEKKSSGLKGQEIKTSSHFSYQPGDIDDSGDTYMGGVNAAGVSRGEQRRALWKSKAQIEKLRSEGKCYRCERQGCIIRKFPLLPAIRPKGRSTSVNKVAFPEISPLVYYLNDGENQDGGDLIVSEN